MSRDSLKKIIFLFFLSLWYEKKVFLSVLTKAKKKTSEKPIFFEDLNHLLLKLWDEDDDDDERAAGEDYHRNEDKNGYNGDYNKEIKKTNLIKRNWNQLG